LKPHKRAPGIFFPCRSKVNYVAKAFWNNAPIRNFITKTASFITKHPSFWNNAPIRNFITKTASFITKHPSTPLGPIANIKTVNKHFSVTQ
jgi:hypothetical protein